MKNFFHLVNPSPWPALSALSALSLIVTLVGCFHNYVGSFASPRWFRWKKVAAPAFVVLPGEFVGLDQLFDQAPGFSLVVSLSLVATVCAPHLVHLWLNYVPRRYPFDHFQPAVGLGYLLWFVMVGIWEYTQLPMISVLELDWLERLFIALCGYSTLFLTVHLRLWYQQRGYDPRFALLWWLPLIFIFLRLASAPPAVSVLLFWGYMFVGVHYLILWFGFGCAKLGWDCLSLYEVEPPAGPAAVQRVGVQVARVGAIGTVGGGAFVLTNGILDRRHQKKMLQLQEEGKTVRCKMKVNELRRHNEKLEQIVAAAPPEKAKGGWFSSGFVDLETPGWSDLLFDRDHLVAWVVGWFFSLVLSKVSGRLSRRGGCLRNCVGSSPEVCRFLVGRCALFSVFIGWEPRFGGSKANTPSVRKRFSVENDPSLFLTATGVGFVSTELAWLVAALFGLTLVVWYWKVILDLFTRPIDPANHPFVRFPKATLVIWLFWTVWNGDDLGSRIYALFTVYGLLYWGTHLSDYLRWWHREIPPPPPTADFSIGPVVLAYPAICMVLSALGGTATCTFWEGIWALVQYGLIGWGGVYLLGHLLRWLNPHLYTPLEGPQTLPFLAMLPALKKGGELVVQHKTELALGGTALAGTTYAYQENRKTNLAVRVQKFHEKTVEENQRLQSGRDLDAFYFKERGRCFKEYQQQQSTLSGRFFPKPFQPPTPEQTAEKFWALRGGRPAARPLPPPSPGSPPPEPTPPPPSGGDTWGWSDLFTHSGRWHLLGLVLVALGRLLLRWWRGWY